jgi:GNAT superfamily N-acetyltransferase
MLLRPLRDDDEDVEAARQVTVAAFSARDAAAGATPREWPPERSERFRLRTRHLVRHDAGGCWIAEHDSTAVGVVMALRREGLWGLSLLVVLPAAQDAGVGRALLERAAAYGSGCLRGIICSTEDPRAVRRYRKAGFTVYPAMRLHGMVDRTAIPDPDGIGVHEGSAGQVDLLDSVDRRVRGAGHGPDHAFMVSSFPLLVVDTFAGSGYCYLDPQRGNAPALLAATSRRLATLLLWEALSRATEGADIEIPHLTAEQEWAVDVGLAAGLALRNAGYVCLRGMRPPAPYLPSAPFL